MSVEEAVRAYFRDRLTNDPELLRDWFAPGAVVSVNGSGVAADDGETFRMRGPSGDDPDAVGAFTEMLVRTWHLLDYEILSILVDGNRAVTRAVIEVECQPTGRRARSEICDHFEFNGERITSIIEFVDTALAERLLDGAPEFPADYVGQRP